MVDLIHCLTNVLFFNVPLLYCYTNFNLSIICCLYFGDIYLFCGTFVSPFFSSLRDCETLVILSAIFYQLNHRLLLLLNCSFWSSFYRICCRFFSAIKNFWPYLLIEFLPVFCKRQKSVSFYIYSISRFRWITHFYNGCVI